MYLEEFLKVVFHIGHFNKSKKFTKKLKKITLANACQHQASRSAPRAWQVPIKLMNLPVLTKYPECTAL